MKSWPTTSQAVLTIDGIKGRTARTLRAAADRKLQLGDLAAFLSLSCSNATPWVSCQCASRSWAQILWIVQRPGRDAGGVKRPGDVNLPCPAVEVRFVHGQFGLDHHETNGPAQVWP